MDSMQKVFIINIIIIIIMKDNKYWVVLGEYDHIYGSCCDFLCCTLCLYVCMYIFL